jgi:hypothetical protein
VLSLGVGAGSVSHDYAFFIVLKHERDLQDPCAFFESFPNLAMMLFDFMLMLLSIRCSVVQLGGRCLGGHNN